MRFDRADGATTRCPISLGIRTRLIAVYASMTSFVGATPGTGRGRVMTTIRRAVAGMELSTEFSVVRLESFSIRGASIVFGIFVTRGARLAIALGWI